MSPPLAMPRLDYDFTPPVSLPSLADLSMPFAGKSENTGFGSMGPKKRVLPCMAALSQGTKLPHCTLGLITEIIMIPQSALLPSTCENQPGGASFCLWPPFPRRLISYRKTSPT